ncbi:MAG: hypothetical protein EOO88_47255 [Pedobacter sp.]|nr:MAG: hypothetical protein EOO88_47255 [Pedobacter sp.]
MKYFLAAIVLLILLSLVYKYLLAKDDPVAYTNLLAKQSNQFTVPKDSADIVWQRAQFYLDKNASLISGGTLIENDSLLYIPYYNDHKKGNSIRIEKHVSSESIAFIIQWWYSGSLQVNGSKEIALFMQQHIDKSAFE